MSKQEIERVVSLGESEDLEFKKSTASLSEAISTLCGFLNKKGGKVFIGVNAEGKLVGQSVSDKTLQEIAGAIHKLSPPAAVDITRYQIKEGKEIIELSAFPSKLDIPYTFDGRPFQRVGTTTSIMPQQNYQKLLLERNHQQQRWETAIAHGLKFQDLNSDEILKTVRIGAEVGRLPEYRGDSIDSILERLGLAKGGNVLNAAVVLFGSRFLPEYPQCQLRMARFKGDSKSEFIDQQQLTGNAFQLLDEAMLFLRRHLPVAGKIVPGVLERKDEPLFPLTALREALVNAFCHRSYQEPGGAVSIAIFDDRLEIWNDGQLPFGLKPEDLKKDHVSQPRNPLIANVFYCRGLIEKWGRGTQKIVDLCIKAGHAEPIFFEQANSFVIRFASIQYVPPNQISLKLTERQREMLQIIAESKQIGASFSLIQEKITHPLPKRSLQEDCQHLKRLGLITFSGFGRGAKWYLTDYKPLNG